jgi:hypothetical protein
MRIFDGRGDDGRACLLTAVGAFLSGGLIVFTGFSSSLAVPRGSPQPLPCIRFVSGSFSSPENHFHMDGMSAPSSSLPIAARSGPCRGSASLSLPSTFGSSNGGSSEPMSTRLKTLSETDT